MSPNCNGTYTIDWVNSLGILCHCRANVYVKSLILPGFILQAATTY